MLCLSFNTDCTCEVGAFSVADSDVTPLTLVTSVHMQTPKMEKTHIFTLAGVFLKKSFQCIFVRMTTQTPEKYLSFVRNPASRHQLLRETQ